MHIAIIKQSIYLQSIIAVSKYCIAEQIVGKDKMRTLASNDDI